LITSELVNDILTALRELNTELEALSQSIGTGNTLVPSVFGRPLSTARAILTQPVVNLRIGRVLDAAGTTIDPDLAAVQQRVVINQIPPPQMRAAARSQVDLVLGGGIGTGDEDRPRAPILANDPFFPQPVSIGTVLLISGEHFARNFLDNTVTFDGVLALGDEAQGVPDGAPLPGSTTTLLRVQVPEPPEPPEADNTVSVMVVVDTGVSPSVSAPAEVAPAPDVVPDIESVFHVHEDETEEELSEGGLIPVDATMRIEGSGFIFDESIIVRFGLLDQGEEDVEPLASATLNETQLSVEVPDIGSGPIFGTQITVVLDPDENGVGVESNAFEILIDR
jgi:hypothetical protein